MKRVANQLAMYASSATTAQSTAHRNSGIARIRRKKTVSRFRCRSSLTTSRIGCVLVLECSYVPAASIVVPPLAALELRISFLQERVHSFAEVLRPGRGRLQLSLHFELLLQPRMWGVVEQALREADPACRHRGELAGPLRGPLGEAVVRHHLGDEAPLERLGRAEPPAGGHP